LHHGRTGSYFRADDQGADFDRYEIAATQLAIDGEIKQGAITHPPFSIKEEADRPYLARF
jgi:hypothetical protein